MTLIEHIRLRPGRSASLPPSLPPSLLARLVGLAIGLLGVAFLTRMLFFTAADPGHNPGWLLVFAWLLVGAAGLAAVRTLHAGRTFTPLAGLALSACLLLEMRQQPLRLFIDALMMVAGFGILAWAGLFASDTGLWQEWRQQREAAGRRGAPEPGKEEEFTYCLPQCRLAMQPPRGTPRRTQLWTRLGEVRPYRELKNVRQGHEGEMFLQNSIGDHVNYQDFVAFPDKRIPSQEFDEDGRPTLDPHGRPKWGRGEMDLLVLTPWALFVYEVKNWNGPNDLIAPQNGTWVRLKYDRNSRQYVPKTGQDDKPIIPGNVVAWNQRKVAALRRYLANFGIDLDPQRIINRVLVTGNIGLHERIRAMPEVITRDSLQGYLDADPGNRLPKRLCCAVMELCGNDTAIDHMKRLFGVMEPELINRLIWILDRAGTWDRISLHGGRVVTGDIINLRATIDTPEANAWIQVVPSAHRLRKTARLNLDGVSGIMESRLIHAELSWYRHKWLGMLLAWCKAPLGKLLINDQEVGPLTGYEVLKMQPAGSQTPVDVPLINIDRIEFG